MRTSARAMAALAALVTLMAGAADAGVVAHWSFDTDFNDSVGGAVTSMSWSGSPSISGDAQFGGGSLNDPAGGHLWTNQWPLGGSFSAAAWLKPTNVATGGWGGPARKQHLANEKVFWYGHHGSGGTYGRVRFGNYFDGNNETAVNAGFTVANNRWDHLVVTWDEATDTQTIYSNGRPIAQEYHGGQSQPSGNAAVEIGHSFVGLIDELWIYDQALTEQQVRNLMGRNDIAKPARRWVRDTWDFESGDLSGWSVLTSGVPGDNAVFTTPGNQPAVLPHSGSYEDQTIQGNYWIRTWEGEVLGTGDDHTGIIETDPFILEPDAKFDFMIGGGNHPFTGDPDSPASNITALTLERMIAVNNWDVLFSATGRNVNFLSPMTWDAGAYAGETVRLRIYDTHPGPGDWGHIDVDNIIYSVTPEPATLSLLGLGALALVRRRRRTA